MKAIREIRYLNSSGSILPEMQWSEEYSLTEAEVALVRKGKIENSQVNAGSWTLSPDRQSLQELFAVLQNLDCAKVKRIDPADPPDGGGSEEFTIIYESGGTCNMRFDPGVSYENGDEYAAMIRRFFSEIELPDGAGDRYMVP